MSKRSILRKVNSALAALGRVYHQGLPLSDIDAILAPFDLKMQDGIYCGDTGECAECVGNNVFMRMQWYRMPSGRFEVTAYVS